MPDELNVPVPETVTVAPAASASVSVVKVPADTFTAVEASAPAPVTANSPPVTVVAPVKVLAAVNVAVPAPSLVNAPVPVVMAPTLIFPAPPKVRLCGPVIPPLSVSSPASELIRVALPSVIAPAMVLAPDTFCNAPFPPTPVPFNATGPAIDPPVIAKVPAFTVTVSPAVSPSAPALVKVPPLITTLPFIVPVEVLATVPADIVTFPLTSPVLVKVPPVLPTVPVTVPSLVAVPAFVRFPVKVPFRSSAPGPLVATLPTINPPVPTCTSPPVIVTPLVAVKSPSIVNVPALTAKVLTDALKAAPRVGWFARAPLFSTAASPAPGAVSPAQLVPVTKLLSVSPSHACACAIPGAISASPRARAVVVSSTVMLREPGTKNFSTTTNGAPTVFDILKNPTRGRKTA